LLSNKPLITAPTSEWESYACDQMSISEGKGHAEHPIYKVGNTKLFDYEQNYLNYAWLVLLMIFACSRVSAQRDTKFWFAVPKIAHYYNWGVWIDSPVYLRITAYDQTANVTVTAQAGLPSVFPNITLPLIPAKSTYTINLSSYNEILPTGPDLINDYGS